MFVTQKYTKFANFASVYFPILPHFATKLSNFTNFKMLILAVVKDFVLFAEMRIPSKMGMVYCLKFFRDFLVFSISEMKLLTLS